MSDERTNERTAIDFVARTSRVTLPHRVVHRLIIREQNRNVVVFRENA